MPKNAQKVLTFQNFRSRAYCVLKYKNYNFTLVITFFFFSQKVKQDEKRKWFEGHNSKYHFWWHLNWCALIYNHTAVTINALIRSAISYNKGDKIFNVWYFNCFWWGHYISYHEVIKELIHIWIPFFILFVVFAESFYKLISKTPYQFT